MVTTESQSGRCLVAGTEVLSWRIQLPRGEEDSAMDQWYREIQRRVVRFCEGDLRLLAEKDFEESEDPKKRFHFSPFVYRLDSELLEKDGQLRVKMVVTLERKRGEWSAVRRELVHIWSQTEDCLIPPPKKKRNG